jgi:hypothetical protein
MDWYEKSYKEGTGGPWKIIDKKTSEKIGVVAYYYHKSRTQKQKSVSGFSSILEQGSDHRGSKNSH